MNAHTHIDLTPAQLADIKTLLQRYLPDTQVWAYGSRVRGNARSHSDLDMVVFSTPQQQSAVSELREAFEESSLPFMVDLFSWNEVPPQFQKNIVAQYYELQAAQNLDAVIRCNLEVLGYGE